MKPIVSMLAGGVMLASASCYGLHSQSPEDVEKPSETWKRPEISAPREAYEMGSRQEDRMDKTRPIAKTVDWLNVSTAPGSRYLNGSVEVDKIFREDANNLYAVKIRMKNRTDETMNLEYKIEFHGLRGQPLVSSQESWTPFMIDPYLFAEIRNTCRIQGAVGFQLLLRKVGSGAAGTDDMTVKDRERTTTPAEPVK